MWRTLLEELRLLDRLLLRGASWWLWVLRLGRDGGGDVATRDSLAAGRVSRVHEGFTGWGDGGRPPMDGILRYFARWYCSPSSLLLVAR